MRIKFFLVIPCWLVIGSLVTGCATAPTTPTMSTYSTPTPLPSPVILINTITGSPQFNHPISVAVDKQGNLYVLDFTSVQKFDLTGKFLTKWGSEGSGDSQFIIHDYGGGIAVDGDGNLYVADGGNDRIQKFDSNGKLLLKWGSKGNGDGQFKDPWGVAIDAQGNVYVDDGANAYGNDRIQKFDSNGKFLVKWGSSGKSNNQFLNPYDVAVDDAGNIYVADNGNARVQKLDVGGNVIASLIKCPSGPIIWQPRGLGTDKQDNIYVVDINNHQVCKFDKNGEFLIAWGQPTGDHFDTILNVATDVAVDYQGNVYVVDYSGDHVLVYKQK